MGREGQRAIDGLQFRLWPSFFRSGGDFVDENRVKPIRSGAYSGRRKIYLTTEDITRENVVSVVNSLLSAHTENMLAEDYLYWYRRGMQPILGRTKQVRPEINNKMVENHAAEIVAFKNGYFLYICFL